MSAQKIDPYRPIVVITYLLFFVTFIPTGILGLISGGAVGLVIWLMARDSRRAALIFVIAVGGFVLAHYLRFWEPRQLVSWPIWVWSNIGIGNPMPSSEVIFKKFSHIWLTAWKWKGSDSLWFGMYGAVWVSAIMVVNFAAAEHLDNTPEGRYRKEKREIKKAEAQEKAGNQGVSKRIEKKLSKDSAARNESTLIGAERSGKQVFVSDKSLNTHALVIGTTGSGKTVSVMNFVESFIQRGFPVLYVDGKGDRNKIGEKIVNFARENGREGHLFSMVGGSCKYNPLASGSYTSRKDRLIELREWSEPHYRKLAEGFLQMVFKVMERCGVSVNLIDIAAYLNRSQLVTLVRNSVASGTLSEDEAKGLMSEIEEQAGAEKHVEGITSEIRNLARSEIGHLFEGEGLRIGEAIQRGEVVYMGLNPLQFPSLAATLGRLIVNDFKSTLDPSNSRQMLIVFDEFGVFAGDQVLNVINQGRSAGVCAVLTVQSVSDMGRTIERNANLFINQVFSNCNNYIIHRPNSPEDAEHLAKVLGTHVAHQLTAQIGETGATGAGSVRRTREFNFHPDMIKNMATGSAIYLDCNGGKKPVEIQARLGVLG